MMYFISDAEGATLGPMDIGQFFVIGSSINGGFIKTNPLTKNFCSHLTFRMLAYRN